MVESGEALGSDEQYGGALIRAGIVQQHIGEAWAELAAATTAKFLDPKSRFIQVDMRDLTVGSAKWTCSERTHVN